MDKSTYYVIIPADIRYDRNIKANEKLLYGELVLLSQEKGYCWATNAYFADLYGVSKTTVSHWLTNLESWGYIKLEYIYKDKEVVERRVYICDQGISKIQEQVKDLQQPVSDDYTKQKEFDEKVEAIIEYFNYTCGTNFKSNTSATRKLIKKHLKESFTLDDFKKVIDIKYEDWGKHPVKFSNGQMSNEYLRPTTLFGDKFETYVYEALARAASEGAGSNSYSSAIDSNRSGVSF